MKRKTFRILFYPLLLVFVIICGYIITHIGKRPELKAPTYSPYTQDEPTEFPNGCGDGVTDCKG